ncbi:MAG: hypothetical protein H5U02_00225 [Clostridia bacterium]|nr:hypothetical protein [Clostridia bacterium]
MKEVQEKRQEKTVTVVIRELTKEEKLEAALAELQEREAARDPKWKPKHDLRPPK